MFSPLFETVSKLVVFEFGKICQSNGLEMTCWGSIEINKCFSRTACSEICKKLNIEHVGWEQEGFRTSFRANASGCVGSKPSFYSRGAT